MRRVIDEEMLRRERLEAKEKQKVAEFQAVKRSLIQQIFTHEMTWGDKNSFVERRYGRLEKWLTPDPKDKAQSVNGDDY